jgi:hypothetical protein
MDKKMPTFTEVQDFIHQANADQLKTMNELIHDRFKDLQRVASRDFEPGDKVFFIKGRRDPQVIYGVVAYLARGKAYIKSSTCSNNLGYDWRVAPTLLQKHTPGA